MRYETSASWDAAPAYASSMAKMSEMGLLYVSLVLLLLSSVSAVPVQQMIMVLWFVSLGLLTLVNIGTAFGVYIASVALYSVKYAVGWSSPLERPDNYAMLIVAFSIGAFRLPRSRVRLRDGLTLVLGAFVVYGLLRSALGGFMTQVAFNKYMRQFGIPFFMLVLLRGASFSDREIRGLFSSLFILGGYLGVVSVLERLSLYQFVLPRWIADPALNQTYGSFRSGGSLLQFEWNGLVLSLIYCLLLFVLRANLTRNRAAAIGGALLCLVAILFTYTRAAWLATIAASAYLLLRPSEYSAAFATTRSRVVAGVVVVALTASTFIAFPSKVATERVEDSGTVTYRLDLWQAASRMAARRPLFGYGFDEFETEVEAYAGSAKWKDSRPVVHNTVFDVLVELGGVGLALYGAGLILIYRKARAAAAVHWGREGAAWVLAFAMVYFIQAQFVVAHEPTVNLIFFGTMGAVIGLNLSRDGIGATGRVG